MYDQPSPAQETMRREMEGMKMQQRQYPRPRTREAERLNGVLNGVLGPETGDPEVRALALEIIEEHPGLTLSLGQWSRVQALVEDAIVAGQVGRRPV